MKITQIIDIIGNTECLSGTSKNGLDLPGIAWDSCSSQKKKKIPPLGKIMDGPMEPLIRSTNNVSWDDLVSKDKTKSCQKVGHTQLSLFFSVIVYKNPQ